MWVGMAQGLRRLRPIAVRLDETEVIQVPIRRKRWSATEELISQRSPAPQQIELLNEEGDVLATFMSQDNAFSEPTYIPPPADIDVAHDRLPPDLDNHFLTLQAATADTYQRLLDEERQLRATAITERTALNDSIHQSYRLLLEQQTRAIEGQARRSDALEALLLRDRQRFDLVPAEEVEMPAEDGILAQVAQIAQLLPLLGQLGLKKNG